MRSVLRKLLLLSLTAFFLTALSLGILAKPAFADIGGLVSLINSYRQGNGLEALAEDQNLVNAACWFATDMGKNNYFDHTDSLGRAMVQRLNAFGISGTTGENIYWTNASSAANNVFTGWKNSPSHNSIMLGASYSRIGIGMSYQNGKWYWVADFANGSATSLNNQCGTAINPPPTPTAKPPAPKPPPPPVAQPTTEEVPIATTTPTVEIIDQATVSATPSAKIVQLTTSSSGKLNESSSTLVKGAALTTITVGNLLLFGFILWRLYSQFQIKNS